MTLCPCRKNMLRTGDFLNPNFNVRVRHLHHLVWFFVCLCFPHPNKCFFLYYFFFSAYSQILYTSLSKLKTDPAVSSALPYLNSSHCGHTKSTRNQEKFCSVCWEKCLEIWTRQDLWGEGRSHKKQNPALGGKAPLGTFSREQHSRAGDHPLIAWPWGLFADFLFTPFYGHCYALLILLETSLKFT